MCAMLDPNGHVACSITVGVLVCAMLDINGHVCHVCLLCVINDVLS